MGVEPGDRPVDPIIQAYEQLLGDSEFRLAMILVVISAEVWHTSQEPRGKRDELLHLAVEYYEQLMRKRHP